jgi:carbon storage regulator
MLVLTRRTGEEIVIGGNIRITVTGIRGDRVRLGITAPEKVRVDRAEVHDRRVMPGTSLPPAGNPQP